MQSLLEPQVRRVVAETLGIDPEELSLDVSLVDDLAADSLDLAELAIGLEDEIGIAVPSRVVERIRTYGDVVQSVLALMSGQQPVLPAADLVSLQARLLSPNGRLLRAEFLTPYVVETLAEDAMHAGRGAHLEVMVGATASDDDLVRLQRDFARLASHGVAVSITREGGGTRPYPSEAA